MFPFLRFWLILELIGVITLPLAWRLFRPLPGRGAPFAKALGLLLTGYVLWLAASFGLLRNTTGGAVMAMGLVLALGLGLTRSRWREMVASWRGEWRFILGVEGLFLVAMAGWAYFRAFNPEIAGTEKPMEIAFIHGVYNSLTFPPRDPWLAGFGISYYYFGYVIISMLAKLAGVVPTVAFNLSLAAIFAFAFTEPLALAHALVLRDETPGQKLWAWLYGLLAGVFVALMGNLEVLLEVLHARGLLSPALLRFFDIKDLASAPVTGSFNPNAGGWWWWRASRVIHDYNLTRTASQEVIDEFPQFSFILGDMHPHVLAIPFAFLMMALALSLFWRRNGLTQRRPGAKDDVDEGGWRRVWEQVSAAFGLDGWGLPLAGLLVGGMGFLNTWDFPIYVFLITLAYTLRRGYEGLTLGRRFWQEAAMVFVSLAVMGILFYLPFYLSFSSQAGGPLPNAANPTRFVQYLLMFGVFITALAFLLAAVWRRHNPGAQVYFKWLLATWLLPALFLALAVTVVMLAPALRDRVAGLMGVPSNQLLAAVLRVRVTTPFTWLVVGAMLAAVAALLGTVWRGGGEDASAPGKRMSSSLAFVLALFGVGLLLTYAVEFVYLKDTFGTRMNTVFKFYYQAWLLMGVGSAYALYYLQTRGGRMLKTAGIGLVTLLTLIGLLYPAFAIPSKANNFQGDPTLDGAAFIQRYQPDLYAVIQWLEENTPPDAVILEAPGRSYTDDNFISAFTGRPTLLGWGGHELQWRGNYDEPGRREPLIQLIYEGRDLDRIPLIVEEFGIDYMIVGPKERAKYRITPPIEKAYLRLWEPVFTSGPYTVYRWKGGP
ncbi:MAG TPA: hypothetical protein ENK60_07840 [Anaerolineae bacterium]|nr:hypothetical protein [Anaerolineae bacterium]